MHSNRTPFKFSAPKVIKFTLIATVGATLFSFLLHGLFLKFFNIPGPQHFLQLTTWGIHHFFIWQFLSYIFVKGGAFSFDHLFSLLFHCTILFGFGSTIVSERGARHFVALYFGSALFVGLTAYLSLLGASSSLSLAGATYSIYALFAAWAFLFPTRSILFFFVIPLPAKYLTFGLILLNLFSDLSKGLFLSAIATLSALLYGYLYPLLCWELRSPFFCLHSFDTRLIALKRKIANRLRRRPKVTIMRRKRDF